MYRLPSLLDKLSCPHCHGDLNIRETCLLCSKCQKSFETRDNLADFTAAEITPWKQLEIEQFDDLGAYQELMDRPYFQYLKSQIRQYILKLDLKDKNILEIGAGNSIFAAIFDDSNEIVLTDINKKLLIENICGKFLVAADAENLPFKDNSFDFIYVIGLVHHLPNQLKGLSEIRRIVKTNGQIFISEPTKWSLNLPYYLARRILLKFLGRSGLKKLIGCGTPYESFIDLNKLNSVFKDWNVRKRYLLPFRLPPLKILDRMSWPIAVNKLLEKLPLIKKLGTIVLVDILPSDKEKGYGTEYEKFVLKELFRKLIKKYHIKSIKESPSNNLMGNHQEIFENLEIEFKKESPDMVWNFCEFDYAKPKEFLNELVRINANFFIIITQNNKNIGVWFHRFYHLLLGHDWNHGRIKNMSYKKVVNLVKGYSELEIKEILAFDAPWFILDVYETGRHIKKFLPRGLTNTQLKLSCFETWPFGLKKFLSHHFLILIERKKNL